MCEKLVSGNNPLIQGRESVQVFSILREAQSSAVFSEKIQYSLEVFLSVHNDGAVVWQIEDQR